MYGTYRLIVITVAEVEIGIVLSEVVVPVYPVEEVLASADEGAESSEVVVLETEVLDEELETLDDESSKEDSELADGAEEEAEEEGEVLLVTAVVELATSAIAEIRDEEYAKEELLRTTEEAAEEAVLLICEDKLEELPELDETRLADQICIVELKSGFALLDTALEARGNNRGLATVPLLPGQVRDVGLGEVTAFTVVEANDEEAAAEEPLDDTRDTAEEVVLANTSESEVLLELSELDELATTFTVEESGLDPVEEAIFGFADELTKPDEATLLSAVALDTIEEVTTSSSRATDPDKLDEATLADVGVSTLATVVDAAEENDEATLDSEADCETEEEALLLLLLLTEDDDLDETAAFVADEAD
ncbi:hypothetical protein H2203_003054 [Taxawa tesnikishii (nom. ined.)]|nr:hypothetical protein H2203_003054 [Dothideales sp. JES 119]